MDEARERLKGVLAIDYVIPDYYALRPKKCMGGWGRQFFNISPSGKILPCHAAETITGLEFRIGAQQSFDRLDLAALRRPQPLSRYWLDAGAVCSCAFKEIDFGGCRCQAFALAGDAAATDPACTLSPLHERIFKLAAQEAEASADRLLYRDFAGGHLELEPTK